MKFAAHLALQSRVDQLVLPNAAQSREGGGDDAGLIVVAIAGEVVDGDGRVGKGLAKMGLKIDDYKNKRFAERGYEPALTLVDGALLLVGESAGIDPISGEGIAQAIEYGALAGAFVAEVAAERRVLSDWTSTLRKSRLGIDLQVRTKFIDSFYGAIRSEVEGLLVREATALRSGCRHFAALPPDKVDLARLAFRAGSGWLSAKARLRAARV